MEESEAKLGEDIFLQMSVFGDGGFDLAGAVGGFVAVEDFFFYSMREQCV